MQDPFQLALEQFGAFIAQERQAGTGAMQLVQVDFSF
jgi:hypothetical protein